MGLLKETTAKINDLDHQVMKQAEERVNHLIKPVGSLGKIEKLLIQLAGITRNPFPEIHNKAVIVMAADHGVYKEGIASNPQEITAIQTKFFPQGATGVCAFAKQTNSKVVTVDIGIDGDVSTTPGVIHRKIKYGTDNMVNGPAMTREEAIRSIEVGIEVAMEQMNQGVNLFATGEMGIGNTTASSAITSVVLGLDPKETTWLGANYPEEKMAHKINVIRKAIQVNQPDPKDGIDILSKVGGLEIGGMAGIMIGCAANRCPVVMDGYISAASALIASLIEPKVKDYIIPSHLSVEIGAIKALEYLGLKPMLDLDLRLGEGSGAVLAFNLVEAAVMMNKEMFTFEEAGF
ncbi:nicotinate-nucleotide--dimethylbenzimidazole phosphoribosyltransferase [Oikeobacillus pervagus]|uniref:Nicotinate-nucleotide--dimethylbenzimidazole phosphoribosyltransferase n=1 Tax=Oikeobacillus pervagus TaxID=1325931 RepID=A0AAJ1T6Y9_9BACI|nr:nicotinate-nucleotide--dimethylbenzimidazole phosphoribosyltransferase [Oikeobacillus pervagus]MDQ0215750.1 nicotinate-nucleotide--dimethylbenzimidazole phosphoribosyltransferase [Oikeobacillus pervagus]